MKRLLSIFILFNTLTIHAQINKFDVFGYPSYEDVAEYASARLSKDAIEFDQVYRLAKKADGWYVYITQYNSYNTAQFTKCWSRDKKRYEEFGIKVKDEEKTNVKKDLLRWYVIDYTLVPYYGYVGWPDDIISLTKDSTDFCDSYLEAIARAYTGKQLISVGQIGFGKEETIQLGDMQNSLSPAQQKAMVGYSENALFYYTKLYQRNPKYETFVGNVYTKYSNEIMSTYLLLLMHQNKKEATKWLGDRDVYSPFMLAFAKNMLGECAPNAILLTQGDNDTYPLYYMQARYGYRTDVLIVNYSLLATSKYMNMLRAGVFNEPAIPFTLKPEHYKDDSLDYVKKDDEQYAQLSKSVYKLNVEESGLLKNEIFLINIINASEGKRPIQFTTTFDINALMGLQKYARVGYMTYLLTKKEDKNFVPYGYIVDTKLGYSSFIKLNEVDWSKDLIRGENVERIVMNYRGGAGRLADALYNEGDKEKCLYVLNKVVHVFPDSILPFGVFDLTYPDLYAQCGEHAKAKALADIILNNAIQMYSKILNDKMMPTKDWNSEVARVIYLFQEVAALYKTNNYDMVGISKYDSEFTDLRDRFIIEKERREKNEVENE